MMLKSSWLGFSALLLTACTALSTSAAIKNWATSDGNWSVDNNWLPVGVPQATDDANIVFGDGVPRTVTIDSTGPADNSNSVTIDLTGGTGASTLAITGNTLTENTATVGDNGNGAINQSGGTHSVASFLNLGNHAVGAGSYLLSGGTLNSTFTEYVGVSGAGTFTQSGGTHSANMVFIGNNPSSIGAYALSGSSSLLQVSYESISQSATGNGTQVGGSFTQTGGSHQVGELYMATDDLSTASYSLSGGTLSAQVVESLAYNGTATFTQTGGANTTLELTLGASTAGKGSYNISAGGLRATEITLGGTPGESGGTGVLTINGTANVNVGTSLNVFNSPGSAVKLQGGTLSTPAINVHGVTTLFQWTGGTLNITNDVVWDPAGGPISTSAIFGSALSLGAGRTLNVTGDETIGGTAPFQLTLTGGSHTVSGDIILNANGTLNTSNSPLSYTNFKQQGGTLAGSFTNNFNYEFHGGTISGPFTNNGVATFASTVSVGGLVQNNGTMLVTSGHNFGAGSGGIVNSGTLTLAGGSLSSSGSVVNAAGGLLIAHGTMGGGFANHGTFQLDGVLLVNNAVFTNDGIVQGGGIVNNLGSTITNSAGGAINATTANAALAFTGAITNSAGGIINIGPTSTLSISSNNQAWSNLGLVNLQGSGARLSGAPINVSSGTIQGVGVVNVGFTNGNTGLLRANGGELDFTAASITNSNAGQIQAFAGSSVAFLQGMSTNSGTITLTGGTFDNVGHNLNNGGTINGYGTIRASAVTNSQGKLLSIAGGDMDVFSTFTNNGVVNIQTGRSAYFYGNVNGSGAFTGGGTAVFLGSVSPGNSPATVTVAGGATLVGGTSLAIELGGTTPGTEYDQLKVGGALSIGGILSVSLINSFMPAVGSSFDLLDWGTLSGTFSSLNLPTLSVGQWDTSQLYTTGILSVAPGSALAGDYNNNGVVDAADYVAWRHGLGTTYTQTDYDVWRTHFGATAGGGSQLADGQTVAVPEPATMFLALLGPSCWTLIGRRRRS